MTEAPSSDTGKSSKLVKWIRAGVVSLCGLVSGAGLMYFSPLLDRVIKPSKPLANFQSEIEGLKVVFHNRSSGGSEGWWDFGDGSALLPFTSTQDAVSHVYTRPGTYTVKLSLRNLFGEENERSANVALEPPAAAAAPAIETFEVTPIRPDTYAPATFRVLSKVKNADLCVWAPGGEHAIEVIEDVAGTQERYVTFKEPGTYTLRLAAHKSRETVQRTQSVQVGRQPPGTVMACLKVTHQAVHVATEPRVAPVGPVEFPANSKGDTYPFTREVPAPSGYRIVSAQWAQPLPKGAPLKGAPRLEVSKDGQKVVVTGALVKNPKALVKWASSLTLKVERQTAPAVRAMHPVYMPLTVPGMTTLPMPPLHGGWVSKQRTMQLDLTEGQQCLWQCGQAGRRGELTLNGRRYRVLATEAGNELRINVVEAPAGN
ncbi:MAG: PKD domain-containing protein [Gemmataceae bacterium]|nr:PKD domain-containing protein [Gemmataceae bacterium]